MLSGQLSEAKFCPICPVEPKRHTKLINRREAYRLWFEYLRLARQSRDEKVRAALVVSQPFYAPWEMDGQTDFHEWWKTHGGLFEERHVVRVLQSGEAPLDPEALVVEIPLTQSPTELLKKVKALLREAVEAAERRSRKGMKRPTASYRLSDGAEPKLDAVREMLTVYRDVYLRNPKLRGEALLEATHAFYRGRKNKRWAKPPMALEYDPKSEVDRMRAMRNLRRYIQKAEAVMLNVARGQFPGEY